MQSSLLKYQCKVRTYLNIEEDPVVPWLLPEACDHRLHGMLCCDALQALVNLSTIGRQRAMDNIPLYVGHTYVIVIACTHYPPLMYVWHDGM